jgi:hypothetical protein
MYSTSVTMSINGPIQKAAINMGNFAARDASGAKGKDINKT